MNPELWKIHAGKGMTKPEGSSIVHAIANQHHALSVKRAGTQRKIMIRP